MSRAPTCNFIVTREYRRFAEFCDACRRYRYIGLCYGPPGVGKTLSARHYSGWDRLDAISPVTGARLDEVEALQGMCTVLYTPSVLNTPAQVARDIKALRESLRNLSLEPLRREDDALAARVRRYELQRKQEREELFQKHDWSEGPPPDEPPRTEPTWAEVGVAYTEGRRKIADPTSLVIVDEADRLRMTSLEQMRAIFDEGDIGLVLLGMLGLEKRLARYPQLYSRVGFVHEFRALQVGEVRSLLVEHWRPAEVTRSLRGITDEDVVAAVVRITGGNFRLLHRLLAQIARVMDINALQTVTPPVVEAARESLVIGVS